jgi:hypothetical protein
MDPLWKLMEFSKIANIVSPGIDPICGWDWVMQQKEKVYPEQGITVFYKGQVIVSSSKPVAIKSAMKTVSNDRD